MDKSKQRLLKNLFESTPPQMSRFLDNDCENSTPNTVVLKNKLLIIDDSISSTPRALQDSTNASPQKSARKLKLALISRG